TEGPPWFLEPFSWFFLVFPGWNRSIIVRAQERRALTWRPSPWKRWSSSTWCLSSRQVTNSRNCSRMLSNDRRSFSPFSTPSPAACQAARKSSESAGASPAAARASCPDAFAKTTAHHSLFQTFVRNLFSFSDTSQFLLCASSIFYPFSPVYCSTEGD